MNTAILFFMLGGTSPKISKQMDQRPAMAFVEMICMGQPTLINVGDVMLVQTYKDKASLFLRTGGNCDTPYTFQEFKKVYMGAKKD